MQFYMFTAVLVIFLAVHEQKRQYISDAGQKRT